MCFAISGFQSWLMDRSAKPIFVGSSPTLSALGEGGILKLVKRSVLKTLRSVKRRGGSNPSTSAWEVLLVHE